MTQTMTERIAVLTAEHIRKDFLRQGKNTNVFHAVQDTDLCLYAGTLILLKGRSGSGKTTLLNMLSGLLRPTTGCVRFSSPDTDAPSSLQDLYALDDDTRARIRNRHFGYIPQGSGAIGSLNLLGNILLPYTLYDDPLPDRSAYDTLLDRLHIAALKDAYPAALSGGELKRMAVARALLRRPALLFADEPTGDLDGESTRIVFGLLREAADAGMSVLVVTHEDTSFVHADEMYHMDAGILTRAG